jgi:hypothetical protein
VRRIEIKTFNNACIGKNEVNFSMQRKYGLEDVSQICVVTDINSMKPYRWLSCLDGCPGTFVIQV